MGIIRVEVGILNPKIDDVEKRVRALVDTGATLSKIPEDVLYGLGIEPVERRRFRLANGRLVSRRIGNVYMRIQGRLVPCQVSFGRRGETPFIGVTVLECAGLAADPARHRLVPGDYLMYEDVAV